MKKNIRQILAQVLLLGICVSPLAVTSRANAADEPPAQPRDDSKKDDSKKDDSKKDDSKKDDDSKKAGKDTPPKKN